MISEARTTTPSTVHDLSGSREPGNPPPPFEPVAELPDPFISLGDAAATLVEELAEMRTDATIIGEARALENLIEENERRWEALPEDLEDNHPQVIECNFWQGEIRDASDHLTARAARTPAEVAAKASALVVAIGDKPNGWYENMGANVPLIVSTLRDATALADHAAPVPDLDAHLFDLIDKHTAAEAVQDQANEAAAKAHATFQERRPPIPAALWWRPDDALGCGFARKSLPNGNFATFYDIPHVAKLRKMAPPVHRREEREPIPGDDYAVIIRTIKTPDERRAARVAEIIAAADDLEARTEALADEVGLTEANRLADEASDVANGFEAATMRTIPASPAGWRAKASWLATRSWPEEYLSELALQIVRDMARLPDGQQFEFGDAPLPAGPDRAVIESYRTFLDMELRYLDQEMGLRADAARIFWTACPAGQFHRPRTPPPSTRATAVLAMFSVMPGDAEVPFTRASTVEAA